MVNLVIYIYIALFILCEGKECNFQFGSVAVKSPPLTSNIWTRNIAAGWQMALNDYHNGNLYNMESITSNIHSLNSSCTFTMDIRDASYFDAQTVLTEMFDITELYKHNNINIPIILGPEWSSISIITNPLINTFNMIQISSGATSTALSEKGYNSFFRTIPNDFVQSKALILLCQHFGWNSVGITYVNNNYGYSFQSEIVSFGDKYNISTQSFGFVEGDNATLKDAIQSMKHSELYIFILITTVFDHKYFMAELAKNEMLGYPYYYIGNEAFFSWDEYESDILPLYGGAIGTCPWSATINDIFESQYPFPVNISSKMYHIYYNRFMNITKKPNNMLYNLSNPTIHGVYGYDSATALIKAIDKFIQIYDIVDIEEFNDLIFNGDSNGDIIDFKNILKDIWFIGLSGNVSFSSNGDRRGGLYSYCNVDPDNGLLYKIGFIIDDAENDFILNENEIKWPYDFVDRGIIPGSEYREYPGIAHFSSLPIIIWCISYLSILIVIVYIICLFYYRKRKIIRASQWKLNILLLCGCIIAYIALIVYGIDESFPSDNMFNPSALNWSILCNVRILLLNISFSFIFGPLLCKVYRIKRLFNMNCEIVALSAGKMALYNLIYVVIESIIVIIIICFIPYNRTYVPSIYDNHTHYIEYYGSCTVKDYNIIYYIFLFVPKFIGMIYCVFISVSVYSTVTIMKYNEGLKIIFSVLLSTLLIIITVSVLYSININDSFSALFFYGFLSLMLLIICNFVSSIMILPRLMSIWKGADSVYESNAVKKFNKINVFMAEFRTQLDTDDSSKCPDMSPNGNSMTSKHINIESNMYNITNKT